MNQLDAVVDVNNYAAMVIYFSEELGDQVVEEVFRYLEQRGYGGEVLWAALPPDAQPGREEMVQAGELGPALLLAFDFPAGLLVDIAARLRAGGAGGPFTVVGLDTRSGEIAEPISTD